MSASRKPPDTFFLGRFLGLAEVLRDNPTHTDWVLKELLVIKDENVQAGNDESAPSEAAEMKPEYEDEPMYETDGCGECEDGYIENDCFEDTCCCADPLTSHGFRPCPNCNPGGK